MGNANLGSDVIAQVIDLKGEGSMSWPNITAAVNETHGTDHKLESLRSAWRRFLKEAKAGGSSTLVHDPDNHTITVTTARSNEPFSLEHIVAEHDIDLSVLKNVRYTVGKWGSPTRTGDVVTLYTAKAIFELHDPALLEVPNLVSKVKYRKPARPKRGKVGLELLTSDWHIGYEKDVRSALLTPFVNRLVLDAFLQLCHYLKPDRVGVLGDILDLAAMSNFKQKPQYAQTLAPAACEAHWWLSQLRAMMPKAPIMLHEGNHDARITRLRQDKAPELLGVQAADECGEHPQLSVPRLLGLNSLGIEWIGDYPNDAHWINGVRVSHGELIRSTLGGTAKVMVERSETSEVFGHTHRVELVSRTKKMPDGSRIPIYAVSIGCACHIGGIVPSKSDWNNWQNAFCVVQFKDGHEIITPVPVSTAGVLLWDGKVFQGKDRTAEIAKAYPDWNWGA